MQKWTDITLRAGVFLFVQFSERKDAVESFMVAGKKVVKLDQIYFWFSFPFCNCKRFDLLYIGYIFNTQYLCESICTFYKKSSCTETCSHEIQVCLFVCFVFLVPLENFPSNGDVTVTQRRYANFDIHLVLMVIEKWRF